MHHRLPPPEGNRIFWTKIWKYKIPQRVKHFAYRLSTDSLPTTENLRKRTMDVATDCPLCRQEGATTSHLFFECPYAKSEWQMASVSDTIEANRKNKGETWLRSVLETNTDEVAELCLMLCDGIWFQRNREIFEGKHTDLDMDAATVISSLRCFRDANGWPNRKSPALHAHASVCPPEEGMKVYFDAGLGADAAGVGLVAFGENGEFLRAQEKKYGGVTNAALAEGMALEDAILMAVEMNANNPIFIGDALGIVRMTRGDEAVPLLCSGQISKVQSLLDVNGLSPPFRTNRDNNIMAHSLAAHAKTGSLDFCNWATMPPFFLSLDTGRFPVF